MLFDFGFNLSPSVDDIKHANKKKQLPIKLANCERRISMISQGKCFDKRILDLLRDELDLREKLKKEIESLS